jgi:hypothetical protein
MPTSKAEPKNGIIKTMVEKLHHPPALPPLTPLDNEKDATEEPTATVQSLLHITLALLVTPYKFAPISF